MLYLEDYLESEYAAQTARQRRFWRVLLAKCVFLAGRAAPAVSLAVLTFFFSGSDRAASHGPPRQVHGNAGDGPAGAEYVNTPGHTELPLMHRQQLTNGSFQHDLSSNSFIQKELTSNRNICVLNTGVTVNPVTSCDFIGKKKLYYTELFIQAVKSVKQ